jgi:glycerophosphoryl diester phosphodiesterase
MADIIAHRGASGYLPEHTLPAKAMAYAMNADFLEQDVVATRDDQLVVLHDIFLDRVTDVADCFPHRLRTDGRYYVRDFDLLEIRQLSVTERLTETGLPVYPGRFPPRSGCFRVHTLAEELQFVAGLNQATGKRTGVYPEIKRPAWHQQEGFDLTSAFLRELAAYGYERPEDPIFVQCFDASEIRRIRDELDCKLRLVQLIGEDDWQESDTDYTFLRTDRGLAELASTVDAVGPWLNQLYTVEAQSGGPVSTGLVERAHFAGLLVHPYTFRADDLPAGFRCFEDLLQFFVVDIGIDGMFTDFPDLVNHLLRELQG